MSVRGIPVQDLPENQDPSVRKTVIEQTGQVIEWPPMEKGTLVEERPKRGRKAKAVEPADAEESGEPGDEAPAEVAAMNVRELGS